MREKLFELIEAYRNDPSNSGSPTDAVAAITTDLRHYCDRFDLDYGKANSAGFSWYCEENGQTQAE